MVVDAIRYPTLPDFDQACGSGRNFVQVCLYYQSINQLFFGPWGQQGANRQSNHTVNTQTNLNSLCVRCINTPSVYPRGMVEMPHHITCLVSPKSGGCQQLYASRSVVSKLPSWLQMSLGANSPQSTNMHMIAFWSVGHAAYRHCYRSILDMHKCADGALPAIFKLSRALVHHQLQHT